MIIHTRIHIYLFAKGYLRIQRIHARKRYRHDQTSLGAPLQSTPLHSPKDQQKLAFSSTLSILVMG